MFVEVAFKIKSLLIRGYPKEAEFSAFAWPFWRGGMTK